MHRLGCRTTRHLFSVCSLAIIVGLGFIGLAMADDGVYSISKKTVGVVPPGTQVQQQSPNHSLVVPPNDECTGAIVIPSAVPACSAVVPDVTSATPTPASGGSATDPASCATPSAGFIANSIWFQWTAPVSGFYKISACIGASCGALKTLTTAGDGVVAIYAATSCAGPFTMVGCDDDTCGQNGPPPQGSPSIIGPISLVGGTNYYILAGNFALTNATYNGTINQYQIRIEQAIPPPNDTCATAVPLVLDSPEKGTVNQLANNNYQVANACYTTVGQVGNTNSNAAGRDVAYSFTAPDEGDYSFYLSYYNAATDTAPDSILYVSGTCPAADGTIPSCLNAANRNIPVPPPAPPASPVGSYRQGGSEYALCTHLTAGQTVYPIVDATASSNLDVTFRIVATRCHYELEFNGTPAGAEDPDGDGTDVGLPNSATAACPVEGSILTFVPANPDIDFFTLGTNPGSRLFAMLNCDGVNPRDDLGTSANLDMRLTTATDTLEYDDQDLAQLFSTLCPNIEGAILPAGPAYLRINHFTPATSAEPYRLTATIRAPGAGPLGTSAVAEDPEPNDASIQFADYVYGNHPDTNDDYDYFGFAARKGDQIMINSDGDPTKDNTPSREFLLLFDTGGNVVPVTGTGVSAAAASLITPSPGTLTGTSPRYPGDAVAFKSDQTGLFIAGEWTVAGILGSNTPGDYLFQASLNCNSASTGGGITADLSILKTGPATATAGQDIVYTIVVNNAGPDLSTLTAWTDLLPPGTTFVDLTGPSDWVCATPNPGDTGSIECDETTFAFDGSATFTLTVNVAPCAGNIIVSNTAEVSSATTDPDTSNNSSTANTTVTDPGTCDDGDACTTNDVCTGNVCTGGPALNCDDSNACTDDSCDSVLGCQHANNSGACDDGNSCTTGDTCSGGACSGTNSPAGTACTSDGNVCTTDACDGSGVCAHVNNTVACDDGSACTTNDTCSGGSCHGGAALDCNDGNVCTNDSCNPATGCVNACNNSCNTKGQGYWKRLCHGPHSGDFYTQRDVDCVNNSCTFAGVTTISAMCDKLDQHGHAPNDQGGKCAKAEEKFMALLLNRCRCRVQGSQSLNSRCGPHQTVDQSIANSDANLCNPARTRDDCEHADCASTEIDNGEALWANTLRITRVGQSVKLTWSPPYAQPDEANTTYKIWRRVPVGPGQSPVVFTQIGTVHGSNLTYTDSGAATSNFEYEITAD